MLLIKGAEIYSPEYKGYKDILIGGSKILAIDNSLEAPGNYCRVINAAGMKAIPGLIDNHVHIAGAGGEGGPATRTSEVNMQDFIESGITSVIGCLGTDGITRTVESVLMKAKALRAEGLSAWIYTGSYQVPTPTILGDAAKDLALIEEVIAIGEVAIADHRSSHPTADELAKIASKARVGGMLGGKAGLVMLHMGDARDPFRLIYNVVANSELKLKQFLPTHCNRNPHIFDEAKTYGKSGYVDITTSSYPYFMDEEIKPSVALKELLAAGVPIENITFSSDAGGSLPGFDEGGALKKIMTGRPHSLLAEIIDSIKHEKIPMETALQVGTSNVAGTFKLSNKGRLERGKDADVILLDGEFQPSFVVSMGEIMMEDKQVIKQSIISGFK